MKRYSLIYPVLTLGLIAFTAHVARGDTTYVSGAQSGYWSTVGSPYIVTGDIIIPENNSLSIGAGVEVLFLGTHRILANVSLIIAYGTETDSIIFKPFPGCANWGSIHILNTPPGKSCHFNYCLFKRADGAPENDRWGGAFYTLNGYIEFSHCKFIMNSAYTGAAIFGHLSRVTFDYCEVFRNHNDWKGGAINFNTGSVDIKYTAICHNSAVYEAGGVYAWLGDMNFTNCTICYNSASDGGGIFNYPGETTIDVVNCIIYNCYGGNITGPGYSIVTYSDIGGGWPGAGNIDENPMFVNPGEDNYHLMPDSPCIDAGDPQSPPDPDGTRADMGAYYFDQTGPGGSLFLDLEPINPPIVIPPQGGSFEYTVSIINDAPWYVIFDAWVEFMLPGGTVVGPYFLHPDIYLGAGASLFHEMEMYVPASVAPGTYEYRGYLGDCPDTTYASDYFPFEKEPVGGSVLQGPAYAILSGWDMEERIDLPSWQVPISDKLDLSGWPNPFNPETSLRVNLPASGQTRLIIYDLAGRAVMTLLDRDLGAGWHSARFDGSHLASGIYLAVLEWQNSRAVERLLLIK